MSPADRMRYIRWTIAATVGLVVAAGFVLIAPPKPYPAGKIITIERGASVAEITTLLRAEGLVKHPAVLEFIFKISGESDKIAAGMYEFGKPQNAFTIARRLLTGAYEVLPIRVTFPEGMSVREMGETIASKMPLVPALDFVAKAKSEEGYLFPDTYLFAPASAVETIIKTMRANFDAKLAALASDVAASGRSLSDVVIMASLIEKEARTTANRRLVSGVLWNRIELGMPLQADAVFGYIFNRDTYSPTYEDLTVDSPYNVYTHRGLPPGPINNPGLDALLAALHPTQTDYLYYLTDKDGVMHYAKTYAAHLANEQKYLR